ncbi:MAG: hypothetical protein AAF216_06245 [Pseudomonadota bacterium]
MSPFAKFSGAAIALVLVSGCATVPEPCTADWVDYQIEQVTRPFIVEHRRELRTLRDLAGDLENPDIMTAFRLAGQADNIVMMVEDFRDTAVPDIRAAVAQCDQPRAATKLLADMLQREGVDSGVIRWIEALGVLVDDA